LSPLSFSKEINMRPTSITVSSAASSAWIPVNYRQNSFLVGVGVVVPSGTLTYKVQHTYDDIFDSSVTPVAFDHATITGKSANFEGSYTSPVRAIRLTVTAYTDGSAVMTLLQGV
jgi:hypothetical protein